jgi:hypothetical protein
MERIKKEIEMLKTRKSHKSKKSAKKHVIRSKKTMKLSKKPEILIIVAGRGYGRKDGSGRGAGRAGGGGRNVNKGGCARGGVGYGKGGGRGKGKYRLG